MSSGVQCAPDCVTEFEKMKIRSEYAYIIYKMPDNECRYAVLDVEINTKAGATANKLIFIAWSDDNASIKPKMLYASSKDALKKTLTGINEEYQATDRSDLDLTEIKKKAGNVA